MKKWYNSGFKVSLVFSVALILMSRIFSIYELDLKWYFSSILFGAGLWQLVLTWTGHYKQ